jgi:hypothetical protein
MVLKQLCNLTSGGPERLDTKLRLQARALCQTAYDIADRSDLNHGDLPTDPAMYKSYATGASIAVAATHLALIGAAIDYPPYLFGMRR